MMKVAGINLICILLTIFLTSCGEDDFFRTEQVSPGVSAESPTPAKLPLDPGLQPEPPEECRDISGPLSGKIAAEDYMTKANYDEDKLDDFVCSDGKVIFCHVPPGNYAASHFIEIGDSDKAIAAHFEKKAQDEDGLWHYSYLLRCSKFETLGVALEEDIGCSVICQ